VYFTKIRRIGFRRNGTEPWYWLFLVRPCRKCSLCMNFYFRSVFVEICNHSHFLKPMTLLNSEKLMFPFSSKTFWPPSWKFKTAALRQPFLSIILPPSEIWWWIWWLSLHFGGQGNWWGYPNWWCNPKHLRITAIIKSKMAVIDTIPYDQVLNCTPEKWTAQTYHHDWVWYH